MKILDDIKQAIEQNINLPCYQAVNTQREESQSVITHILTRRDNFRDDKSDAFLHDIRITIYRNGNPMGYVLKIIDMLEKMEAEQISVDDIYYDKDLRLFTISIDFAIRTEREEN